MRKTSEPGAAPTSDGVRSAPLRASSSSTLGSPSLTPHLRKGPLGLLLCPGNPVDTGARQTTVHAVVKSQTRLSTQRTRKSRRSIPLPPPVSSRKTGRHPASPALSASALLTSTAGLPHPPLPSYRRAFAFRPLLA